MPSSEALSSSRPRRFCLLPDGPSLREGQDRRPERLPRRAGEPDQDDAFGASPRDEGEPAKVLVLGDEDTPFTRGEGDDLGVHGPGCLLGERTNVVTGGPEAANDSKVEVLVGQEAHGGPLTCLREYDHLVGDRVGGVAQHGLDVVAREARVSVE